jgi:hypothetical protein
MTEYLNLVIRLAANGRRILLEEMKDEETVIDLKPFIIAFSGG